MDVVQRNHFFQDFQDKYEEMFTRSVVAGVNHEHMTMDVMMITYIFM